MKLKLKIEIRTGHWKKNNIGQSHLVVKIIVVELIWLLALKVSDISSKTSAKKGAKFKIF